MLWDSLKKNIILDSGIPSVQMSHCSADSAGILHHKIIISRRSYFVDTVWPKGTNGHGWQQLTRPTAWEKHLSRNSQQLYVA